MAFSGEVQNGTGDVVLEDLVDGLRIADVAAHEGEARVVPDALEVGGVARVGQLVEDDDGLLRVREPLENEVGADESGGAGDEDGHNVRMWGWVVFRKRVCKWRGR